MTKKEKLIYILANCDDVERIMENQDIGLKIRIKKCISKIKKYAEETLRKEKEVPNG